MHDFSQYIRLMYIREYVIAGVIRPGGSKWYRMFLIFDAVPLTEFRYLSSPSSVSFLCFR